MHDKGAAARQADRAHKIAHEVVAVDLVDADTVLNGHRNTGVLIFEMLKTSLQFLGVTPDLQYVAIGTVIVMAVAIDIRKYLTKK